MPNKYPIDDFNPKALARSLAKRMKMLRIKRNMTQVDLASRSGVSLGSLKRFETQHQISLQSLLKLALILDAAQDFKVLFQNNAYQSIDDVIAHQEGIGRKRARSG